MKYAGIIIAIEDSAIKFFPALHWGTAFHRQSCPSCHAVILGEVRDIPEILNAAARGTLDMGGWQETWPVEILAIADRKGTLLWPKQDNGTLSAPLQHRVNNALDAASCAGYLTKPPSPSHAWTDNR